MGEVATCPMERRLDPLPSLSLHGHLPLAQMTWEVFLPSWSLLVSAILQAMEQEGTYVLCKRQPRYSQPLIRLLQLSQTHPGLQIHIWLLGAFTNQPCLLSQMPFPHLPFFQVGVCNLLISKTPSNDAKQAVLPFSSVQIFHPSVPSTEHQIATVRNKTSGNIFFGLTCVCLKVKISACTLF